MITRRGFFKGLLGASAAIAAPVLVDGAWYEQQGELLVQQPRIYPVPAHVLKFGPIGTTDWEAWTREELSIAIAWQQDRMLAKMFRDFRFYEPKFEGIKPPKKIMRVPLIVAKQ